MQTTYHCFNHSDRSLESFIGPSVRLEGKGWVTQNLMFGDCGLVPATESLAEDLVISPVDGDEPGLAGLRKDHDLSEVYRIAKDCDGHRFYASAKTGECFVWYHDPDEFARLDVVVGKAFIEWLVQQRSGLPTARSWHVFFAQYSYHSLFQAYLSQMERVDLLPVRESVLRLLAFPLTYVSEDHFSVYEPTLGLLIQASAIENGTLLDFKMRRSGDMDQHLQHRLENWWTTMKTEIFTGTLLP